MIVGRVIKTEIDQWRKIIKMVTEAAENEKKAEMNTRRKLCAGISWRTDAISIKKNAGTVMMKEM